MNPLRDNDLEFQMSLPPTENVGECYVFTEKVTDEGTEVAVRLTEKTNYPGVIYRYNRVGITAPDKNTGESNIVFQYDLLEVPDNISEKRMATQEFSNLLADIIIDIIANEVARKEEYNIVKYEDLTDEEKRVLGYRNNN